MSVLTFPTPYAVLRGGWNVAADPWPMLLTIAEQRKIPLATLVEVFEAMTEYSQNSCPEEKP